ncbi:hypothetical protein EDC65_2276 [Stella humosa]|uniref:Uncharacterized protein n=1 Tax=Stella humosa TaxID=94 RepID=A0A3N1MCP3_9PROT|nr:hypothetical protein [Stella humosa]ROQ00477.1 hypothetical protein EDC65_2276 [Stella humosa]BBK30278.1 hypothetical protein STHU_09120 [Stella humosa]
MQIAPLTLSPLEELHLSRDGHIPQADYEAALLAEADWHRRHGGAAAASPAPAPPPLRGGEDEVGTLARDIAALYADHDDCVTDAYLIGLGWTREQLDRCREAACAMAARLLDAAAPIEIAARSRPRIRVPARRMMDAA